MKFNKVGPNELEVIFPRTVVDDATGKEIETYDGGEKIVYGWKKAQAEKSQLLGVKDILYSPDYLSKAKADNQAGLDRIDLILEELNSDLLDEINQE